MLVYHATYINNIDSIKESGLGKYGVKNYATSKTGYVYLSSNPEEAYKFAKDAPNAVGMENSIVMLVTSTELLDGKRLIRDSKVKSNTSFVYKGIIDRIFLYVCNSSNKIVGQISDFDICPTYKDRVIPSRTNDNITDTEEM